LLLFSHPADFTPVCTTEFVAFSRKYEEFKKRGVELLGLSVDTNFSHIEWKRQIEQAFGVKIPFPIIADVDMKVASVFNAVPPGQNLTVRTVALIDPDLKLAGSPRIPTPTAATLTRYCAQSTPYSSATSTATPRRQTGSQETP